MKAMILAAGLGTRLKPFTDHHPKALAVVNGKPLLQRNIEYLQAYGIYEVVVNVHHFADQIIEAIEKNNGWGSNVTISDESDEVLETGGGLLRAKAYFENEAKKAHELKSEINRIDCCINALVYKYYGLTQEEIQIVENN
jgi:NDP-sugar pyrophosphorylase family protein